MRSESRSHAIVLKRIAYGEADLIVTFFTRERGRMSGIARSAKKSMRRFGGAFEPGTLAEVSYNEKRGAHLANLCEARVLRPVLGVVKSLSRIEAMTRAVELALAFLQEHQASDEKFVLLNKRIEYLCANEPAALDSAMFDIEWLRLAGFGPHPAGCPVCSATNADAGLDLKAARAVVDSYIEHVIGRPLRTTYKLGSGLP